mmetsp:Transcript_29496/g.45022  ORF Transcript_29496/g.45022 Transcript_29496/m.45022 type:complete len:208 (-) Transcript_29496:83-706(-)
MKEVVEAMSSDAWSQFVSSEVSSSPDLLNRISSNAKLMAGMTNPKFTAALEALQRNPKDALEKFRCHKDVMEFLKEICSVMGDHYIILGQEKKQNSHRQDKEFIASSTSAVPANHVGPLASGALRREKERKSKGKKAWNEDMNEHQHKKVDDIMQDDDLTSMLMNIELQKVIQECSAIPGKMKWYMSDDVYGPQLRKLIENGLLRVA